MKFLFDDLKFYNITPTKIDTISKNTFKITQNNEQFLFKKNKFPKTYIEQIHRSVNLISKNFHHIQTPIITKFKNYTTKNNFTMYNWIQGEKISKRVEMSEIAQLLSNLHSVSSNTFPDYIGFPPFAKQTELICNMYPELNKYLDIFYNPTATSNCALIHTDLTSNNIIVSDNQLFLIDYEFMRKGTIYIDLANTITQHCFPNNKIDIESKNKFINSYKYENTKFDIDSDTLNHYILRELVVQTFWAIERKVLKQKMPINKINSIERFYNYVK